MITLTGNGSLANELIRQGNVEIVSIRKLDKEKFWQQLKNADTIIHNAASINCQNIDNCLSKNFEFSRNIIDFLVTNNPTVNFTYISSMSILDPKSDQITLDEKRMTPYAFSKYKAEQYCISSHINNLKVIRFSTLFYGNPKKDSLSKLIYNAVKNNEITIYNQGEATRDFMPLNIAATYVKKISTLQGNKKEIFNIASTKPSSYKDIALYLKKRIPQLKINNIYKEGLPDILATFSADSINKIGKIDFNLEKEIDRYIEKIKIL